MRPERHARHGRRSRRGGALAFWMRWHRRLGLAAALWLVLAAVTGVLLNHTGELGLAQRGVQSAWLKRWWQVPEAQPAAAQALPGGHWLSQWERQLFLDERRLELPEVERLVGAAPLAPGWLIIDARQALVVDDASRLVERVALPAGFAARRVGTIGDSAYAHVVIESEDTRRRYTDAQASAWSDTAPAGEPRWAALQALPDELRQGIAPGVSGGLTLERVLLDLHSGRWLGPIGVWLTDLAAIVLLVLAASGTWSALRRKERRP
ncbi:PepSY domain-containing protein [Piscinibacter sp.]|uniref:PepSY domain-containing protein n=1 Tax=Piscinibacter sp. TaxID=1903157 RepID=UPI0039E4CE97